MIKFNTFMNCFGDCDVFQVGGSVRDGLIGFQPEDFEFEIFGDFDIEYFENVMASLGGKKTGKFFPVYRIDTEEYGEVEICLPRTERSVAGGHNDFEFICDPRMSVKDAQERRDITINAIYINVRTGESVDHFDGIGDIERKLIVPLSYFGDDPIRAFRAFRFAMRFDFDYSAELITQMLDMQRSKAYKHVTAEIVGKEFVKMIMQSSDTVTDSEVIYKFEIFMRIGGGEEFFPALFNTLGLKQTSQYHKENVFAHSCMVLNRFFHSEIRKEMSEVDQVAMAIACLYHDTGKVDTQEWSVEKDRYTFFGHETFSVDHTDELKELAINHKIIEKAKMIIAYHMTPDKYMSSRALYKLWKTGIHSNIFTFHRFDKFGRVNDQHESVAYISKHKMIICCAATLVGKENISKRVLDSGVKPGPEFGTRIKQREMEIFSDRYNALVFSGEVVRVKTFRNIVKNAKYNDWDGMFRFASKTGIMSTYLFPSEFEDCAIPEWATHVVLSPN